MAKLKLRNVDNTFSEVVTKEYVDGAVGDLSLNNYAATVVHDIPPYTVSYTYDEPYRFQVNGNQVLYTMNTYNDADIILTFDKAYANIKISVTTDTEQAGMQSAILEAFYISGDNQQKLYANFPDINTVESFTIFNISAGDSIRFYTYEEWEVANELHFIITFDEYAEIGLSETTYSNVTDMTQSLITKPSSILYQRTSTLYTPQLVVNISGYNYLTICFTDDFASQVFSISDLIEAGYFAVYKTSHYSDYSGDATDRFTKTEQMFFGITQNGDNLIIQPLGSHPNTSDAKSVTSGYQIYSLINNVLQTSTASMSVCSIKKIVGHDIPSLF